MAEIQSYIALDEENISLDSLIVRLGQRSSLHLSGQISTTLTDYFKRTPQAESDLPFIPVDNWDLTLKTREFKLSDINLNALKEGATIPTGNVLSTLKLTGNPYRPFLSFTTIVDNIGLSGKPAGDLFIYAYYDGHQIVLDSLSVFHRDQRRLHAAIQIPLEITSVLRGDSLQFNDISAYLNSYYADLWIFTFMVPDVFVSRGYLNADINISGDFARPVVEGSFGLEHGLIELMATGTTLAQTTIEAEVIRDTIFVKEFSAGTNDGGLLEFRGWVAMGDFDFPNTFFEIEAKDFKFENLNDISGTVDADMTITGPAAHVLCAGTVDMTEGLVSVPFEEEEDASAVTTTQMLWDFPLDLDLELRGPSVWLRNQQADIELEMAMDVWTQKNLLYIAGDIDVLRGMYYLYDYSFEVTEGLIRFLGTSTIDPQVRFGAETRIRVTESEEEKNVPVLLRITVDGTALHLNPPRFEAFDPETMEPKGYSESDALLALSLGY
ncbi:MAG: hypothetical protein GY869_32890, partial [Planctomycetes bacterium]|nr:hypothetical protein [Planctomycetota bacterium]